MRSSIFRKVAFFLLLVPILIIAGAYIVPNLIPRVYAAGTICLADPSAVPCPATPQAFTAPPQADITTVGGTVQLRVAVDVSASDALNGFDITLLVDHTKLQPFDADLTGSILPSSSVVLAKCIGGVLKQGSACASTDTVDTLRLSAAASSFLTIPPTSGLLFTAVFNVVGDVSSPLSIRFQTGCGSVAVPTSSPPLCVTIENGSTASVPEGVQTATFSTGAAAAVPFFSVQPATGATTTINVVAGATSPAVLNVAVNPSNGFTCTTLTCVDVRTLVPGVAGLTATVSPTSTAESSTAGAGVVSFTVGTTIATPVGTYHVSVVGLPDTTTIPGTGNTFLGSTTTFTIVVGNVQLTPAQASLAITRPLSGTTSGTDTITVANLGSFSITVPLSISPACPAGLTCTVQPPSLIVPGGSSLPTTLTITVSTTAVLTTTTVTVRGVASGQLRTTTVRVTVTNLDTTSTVVFCNPSSVSNLGTTSCTATITDTVSGGGLTPSTPTGSVSFTQTGSGTFSPTSCPLVAGATGTASCSVNDSPTLAGSQTVTGTYVPDATHEASAGSAALTVTTAHPTGTVVICAPSPVNTNTPTTCTATVSDNSPTPTNPTGTVSFSQTGVTGGFTGSPCMLVAGTSGSASCAASFTATTSGTAMITGAYGGDATHGPSTATARVTVSQTQTPTSTSVSCLPNTVPIDAPTTCTATVTDSSTSPTTPGGTVAFSQTGVTGSFSGSPCLLSQGTNPLGTATCTATFTGTSSGSASVSASYTPSDTTHAASSSTTAASITVNLRPTSTTVSCTPSTVIVRQGSVCTATVVDPATNPGTVSTPAGTVAFTFTGTAAGSFTGSPCTLAQGTNPVGTATCTATFTATSAGSASVNAAHTPTDSTHAGSSSTTAATVTVNLRPTTTTVSCTQSTVNLGATSTCTATVVDGPGNAGPVSTPTGTVGFAITGTATGSSFGTTTPCTLTQGTNPVGTASCIATFTAGSTAGSANIVATYRPDLTDIAHATSTSAAFAISVTAGNVPTVSTPALSPNPALVGQQVSTTFTVASSSTVTQITVNWGDGTTDTLAGTATSDTHTYPSSGGFTVLVTATNAAGPGSRSAIETVNLRPTTTTVSCTPGTVLVGQASTCTATVVDPATNAGTVSTPAGTVAFTFTGTAAGSFTGSPCTLAQGTNPVGTTTCTATFTGTSSGSASVSTSYTPATADTAHASSSSTTAATITVNLRPITTTVLCAPSTVLVSQGSVCTATVVDPATNAGTVSTPTGTIAFTFTGTAAGSFAGSPCTLTRGTNPVGTASCTATFSGSSAGSASVGAAYVPATTDTAHAASSSTTSASIAVNLRPTTTTVSCAPSTVNFGATSTCTATVVDPATNAGTVSTPAGTVTFAITGTATGSSFGSTTPCTLAQGAHPVGTASCTAAFTAGTSAGTANIVGSYTPSDTSHATSASAAFPIIVSAGNVPTVSTPALSPNPALVGQQVSATFTVTSGTTVTSVTVNWGDGTTDTLAGTATSDTHTYASSGAFTVTVTATNTSGPGSNSASETVNLRPTTTTVSCSPATVIVAQDSVCTATVVDPATNAGTVSTPSGTIGFSPAADFGTSTPCTLSQGTNPVGTATCTATFAGTSAGSASVNAAYSPATTDTAHAGSSSTIAASITVDLRLTTATVSCAPSTVNFSGSSTCIATVVDPATNAGTMSTPAGSVAFAITGTATGSSFGSSTPCTLSQGTNPVGTASCTSTFTAGTMAGTANIVGTYTPSDTSHTTSRSTAFVITVSGGNVPAVSALALSPNSALVNQQVSVAFTVTSSTTVTQVTVNWGDGTTNTLAGTAVSDTHTYSLSGSFSVTVSATSSAGAGSNAATETVNLRPTSTTVSCDSTVLVGQGSVCTATVIDPTSNSGTVSTPAGSIAFSLTGTATGGFTGSPCTLAQSTNPVGTATCTATFTATSAGSASVSAAYTPATNDAAHAAGSTTTAATITVTARTTSTAIICTSPVTVNQGSLCTVTVTDASPGPPITPTGTFPLVTNRTAGGVFSGSCVLSGTGASAICTVKYTPSLAGGHEITANYPGDSVHAPSSGFLDISVAPVSTQQVTLTFSAFNVDDFDNGVGQLQVIVNGNLVVDIPAGLNHLTGSGDFTPYANTWIKFGPFDITGFVVQGQNTIVFKDPLSSHLGLVRNVTIVQGNTILLHVVRASPVFPGHSATFTFSIPPLVITSFTVSPANVIVDQPETFTVTYTGGTAPFKCLFRFGDEEDALITGSSTTCSVAHDYDITETFNVRVTVIGASTSDVQTARMTVTIVPDPPSTTSVALPQIQETDD